MNLQGKKVAIVADWLTSRGGAERVIFSLAKLFPDAVIFTSVYHPEKFPELRGREVRTSFLQKLPNMLRRKHQFLLPFFPRAFEKLDLSEFDVIISSSSSGFSKCVRKTRGEQKHVCYCHTPVRFLYNARKEYVQEYPLPLWGLWIRPFLPMLLNFLEKKDQAAAKHVDKWIANSDFVADRISRFYKAKATTINPGVETKPYIKAGLREPERLYFLGVGRFIPYKKFDLLIETFTKNKLPLKLAGKGPDFEKCKTMALLAGAENIEFLGFVKDEALPDLYAHARAFLFPAEEDFGLTPVEAMASGTPVIYYAKGGATESVNSWGIAFDQQTPESVQKGIDQFISQEHNLHRDGIMGRGEQFDEENFRKKMAKYLETL
jgi:glycosyltransferase involved in cell wall biosynthesis